MSDRPRKFLKYLRITWTTFFAVLTVLLIVLWVRSYWREDRLGYNFEIKYGFGVASSQGRMTFSNYDTRGYSGYPMITTTGFYLEQFTLSSVSSRRLQWGFGTKAILSPITYLTVPHWSLAILSAVLALVFSSPKLR